MDLTRLEINRRTALMTSAAIAANVVNPMRAFAQETPRKGGVFSVHYGAEQRQLNPSIQASTGVYMGIFNFFVVIPEIVASLFFGPIMSHGLHNNRMAAVIAGGVFLLIAAVLMQRVYDPLDAKRKVSAIQASSVTS